ncbi:DUF4238 domain-containing protein [Thermodesulfobacteriota bacterium]
MGHHYTPQYYLRGFEDPGTDQIWMYDKQGKVEVQRLPILRVAQQKEFYTKPMECYLAQEIEQPANPVLEKIRRSETIAKDDKVALANYLTTMIKRVPAGRDLHRQRIEIVCERILQEYRTEASQKISQDPSKEEFVLNRQTQIEDILSGVSQDPPKDMWEYVIPPEKTRKWVERFTRMTWTFRTFHSRPAFLTCDNPVFYFRHLGFDHSECEVSFPISSHVCLWLTWRQDIREGFIPVDERILEEFNQRTVNNATRWVFHACHEDWIEPFVRKRSRQVHLIR